MQYLAMIRNKLRIKNFQGQLSKEMSWRHNFRLLACKPIVHFWFFLQKKVM